MVDVALRGVDIFRNCLVGFQGTSAETNYSACKTVNGEHNPPAETVVEFLVLLTDDQAGFFQELYVVSFRNSRRT